MSKKLGKGEKVKKKHIGKGSYTIEKAQKLGKLATLLLEDEAFRERFEENTHEVFHEMGISDLPVDFIPVKFKVPIGLIKVLLHPKKRSPGHSDHGEYSDHCVDYTMHSDHDDNVW